MKETENPLSVTSNCIYNRENRMGIDRVKDDVETRLYQESDVIRNTQNKLKDALNSVMILPLYSPLHLYIIFLLPRSTSKSVPTGTRDTS